MFEYPKLLQLLMPLAMNVIIDAGAYAGYCTRLFAQALPNSTVVGLEPSLDNYLMAQLNTRHLPNTRMLRAALWTRLATMTVGNDWRGDWAIQARPACRPL